MVPTPHLISVPSTASSIPYPVVSSSFISLAPLASASSNKPIVDKPPELCHYHLVFGSDSKQCIPPCSFQSEDVRKVCAPTAKPAITSSETPSLGACRYHKIYGPRSEKCERPCIYTKEKKETNSGVKAPQSSISSTSESTALSTTMVKACKSPREVCFFHRTYGLGSFKCQPPCVLSPHNVTPDEANVAKKPRGNSTAKFTLSTPSTAALEPTKETSPGANYLHTIYVPIPSKRRRVRSTQNEVDGFDLAANGTSGICPHHRQFGEKAVECVPPCNFQTSPQLSQSTCKKEQDEYASDSAHKSVPETDPHSIRQGRHRNESRRCTSPSKYTSEGHSRDALAPTQGTSSSRQRASNSPRRQSLGLCVYHSEFGDNAKLCYPPCSYKSSADSARQRRQDNHGPPTRSREPLRLRSPIVCRYHQQFGDAARNCRPPCDFKPTEERHIGPSSA